MNESNFLNFKKCQRNNDKLFIFWLLSLPYYGEKVCVQKCEIGNLKHSETIPSVPGWNTGWKKFQLRALTSKKNFFGRLGKYFFSMASNSFSPTRTQNTI